MHNPPPNFERAVNLDGLGIYGDPARWGSVAEIRTYTNWAEFSPQLVRGQCAGLFGTAWDCLITWAQVGGDALDPDDDKLTVVAELQVGLGQTTQSINWVPMSANTRNGQGAILGLTCDKVSLTTPYYGASLITIPATAINGRIGVAIQGPNQPVKNATFRASLQIAPRVGVAT